MLRKGMYVRCPADYGHQADPRIFICCQVKEINDFEETVTVESYDPFRLSAFFTNLPVGILVYPIDSVKRCHACAGSDVILEGQSYEVLAVRSNGADLDEYYLRNRSTDEPIVRNESKLVISFVNGDIDPSQQLKEYEFQNPAWFVGRSIVSKSMSILDNSINYFKDLAGSRILRTWRDRELGYCPIRSILSYAVCKKTPAGSCWLTKSGWVRQSKHSQS